MSASKVIRPEILSLSAYAVPSAEGFIKLDAMENPHAFPASLQDALLARLSTVSLNRYPQPAAAALKAALRKALHLPDELDILLGNGSDEIIQLIAMACARPGATLLSVEPAFVMFRMIATFCGLQYVGVDLKDDFSLDVPALQAAIEHHQPAVTFLAYPNNPTGNLFDADAVVDIIQACASYGGLVVIDEAYYAFSPTSFLPVVGQYDNVVLMRTLSKLGLAGLRLGLLVGRTEWLSPFDKLRLPYNINALTQCTATFALENLGAFEQQAALIVGERERLAEELRQTGHIRVFASAANFLLIRIANASRCHEHLLSRKIMVKNTASQHRLLTDTLRLTVGTPAENDALIAALKECVQ